MLPATERPKSARSFNNQFLKGKKNAISSSSEWIAMNPRHKRTSATTQQQNVPSTLVLETDENMYNFHRSNHIEQSQREREAWPAHCERHQHAQEEEENNRREHQRVGAALRESASKCAQSRFAGKECGSAIDKQRSFGESVCDAVQSVTAWVGTWYVRMLLCTYYTNSIVPK
jgi:hypothetical protein